MEDEHKESHSLGWDEHHKEGPSLVWDEQGKYREQTWTQLKDRIHKTQGGVGIAADDFLEMLQYRGAPFRDKTWTLRERFSELIADAIKEDDIKLLAEILNVMMLKPWETNIDGGWFISRLRKKDNDEFDAERAALVLNHLYQSHPYATQVLCMTLTSFVESYDDPLTLLDRIRNTNKLEREVMVLATPAKIFISYAKEDGQQAERLRTDLEQKGFKVWKDTHELLPGEKWEHRIKKALQEHDFVVLCLSRAAVAKTGFFQVEVKEAIKWQQYRPDSKVYIIPTRLDDCEVPPEIAGLHYIDLFLNWDEGVDRITLTVFKHQE